MTDRLNQESLDVIAAARGSDRAPPESRARVHRGLVMKLGAAGLTATLPTATTAAAGTVSTTLFKNALFVSLAGGAGGIAYQRYAPQTVAPKPAAHFVPQATPIVARLTPPVTEAPPAEPVRTATPPKQAVRRLAVPPTDLNHLAEETAVLAQVRESMRSGAHHEAFIGLESYQRRFPTGLLREESEATRVQLLHEQGDQKQACRQARAFLKKWPRSPHGVRMREVCERQTLPSQ